MSKQVRTIGELGEPIFISRSSKIFVWEGTKLLKLFNLTVPQNLIDNEEINTIEAFSKGVSKVQCYGQVKVDNQTGIIIEKVNGKTLIGLAGNKPLTVFGVPKLMADLQINLHSTHTDAIRSYKDMVLNSLNSKPLEFLSLDEKQKAIEKINKLEDGDSILHLDYHPDNIMSDTINTTIIDWMTAAKGVPAADIAATQYLLMEGEMIPGLNKAVALILEIIRKTICKNYIKEYKKQTGMTEDEIRPWRLPFLIVRLGVWNIESEIDVLQEKIRRELNA